MVGSSLLRNLKIYGYSNLITKDKIELDLMNFSQVEAFYEQEKPEVVILAAAKVGGINANIQDPVAFLYNNLTIQNNVISLANRFRVEKFIFLGSSCIYPKNSEQPIKEESLLDGKLEATNEGYALAKITGIKLLEYYNKQFDMPGLVLNPCNLYGPNDSFDLNNSHVLSALVRKFMDAKSTGDKAVTVWGTGEARREFMHVDDLARAVIYFMNKSFAFDIINIGVGVDLSIKELAELIQSLTHYQGNLVWDRTKPNGMMRKCLDVAKMKKSGFEPKIGLRDGISEMISIYKNIKDIK